LQRYVRNGFTKVEAILLLGTSGLLIALVAPVLRGSHVQKNRETCLANLGRIGQAIQSYLSDSGNRWPYVSKLASVKLESAQWPTLPMVLSPYLSGPMEVFHCPADARRLDKSHALSSRFTVDTTYFATEGTSYEWWFGEVYGGKKVGDESLSRAAGFGMGRADQPLLSDFGPFHEGDDQGAINTLNADLKPRTSRARPARP